MPKVLTSGCRKSKAKPVIVLRCFSRNMKREWTQGEKIAVWGVGAVALAAIATWVVVPGFRRASHLDPSAKMIGPPVAEPGRLVGVFAASIEELRARNNVTLIPASESEKTLAEIPANSYGFVFAPYLAHSAPDKLQMYTHNDPSYFEVHKLTGSHTEFVGYVGSETQERLRKGLGKGEKLTLYSSPWPKAPNLTAISLRSVKCGRSWDVPVRRKGSKIILFALDCKAI